MRLQGEGELEPEMVGGWGLCSGAWRKAVGVRTSASPGGTKQAECTGKLTSHPAEREVWKDSMAGPFLLRARLCGVTVWAMDVHLQIFRVRGPRRSEESRFPALSPRLIPLAQPPEVPVTGTDQPQKRCSLQKRPC